MSAAQALTSVPVSSSSSARSSSNGAAAGKGDASFRDALETATRSSDAENGRVSSHRARSNKTEGDASGKDGERDAAGGETAPSRTEPMSAADLSAMLAALGLKGAAEGGETGLAPQGVAPSQDPNAATPTPGSWLAGRGEDGGQTLDVAQLLGLLKSGTLKPSDLPAENMTLKVTVAGQETHLALDQASADALAALSAIEEGGKLAEDTSAAAALKAALSQSTDDAAPAMRRRDAAGAGLEQKSETGVAPRVTTTTETWGGRGGSDGLADQGVGGQDGRQSDGRGASGSNGQQGGSGVFAMTLAGNPQTVGIQGQAAGLGSDADPVSEQIAQHLRAELKAGGIGEASSDGVVKVLNIELKPANMGSVTVRIALKDNAVTVHLEAQRSETLAIIEREREALTKALASAGYSVDSITAAPQGEASRSLGSALAGLGHGGASAQGGSFAQGQGLGNSGSQGGSSQAGAGNSSYRPPTDDKDTGGPPVRKEQDGLYV